MTWSRGNSTNGSISFEPIVKSAVARASPDGYEHLQSQPHPGLRFLFRVTLRRLDLASEIYHIRKSEKLALVMSADEIKRLPAMAASLKTRVLLSLCSESPTRRPGWSWCARAASSQAAAPLRRPTTGSERERRLRYVLVGRCNRFLAIREGRGGLGRPF
jgi:hypothetical protein